MSRLPKHKMAQEKNGQVLPFSRSAEQVRSLASKRQAQGNPIKALELLWLSLGKAPEDPETLQAMAALYASIGCLALSNYAYFALTSQSEAYASEGFFGLGVNFYDMQLYGTAHDCLVLSLQKNPDAEFASDAIDLLDAIDEMREPADLRSDRMRRRMERVLAAMDDGRANLAVKQIRRVRSLNHPGSGLGSLEAFAKLAAGDEKGALQAARKAARKHPEDVRALCAMASSLKANRSFDAGRVYLHRASEHATRPDEVQLVCQTACEMGEHAFIVSLLSASESHTPYAEELLHLLAVASHNSGNTQGAQDRWRMLRRINPMDTVATYWLQLAEEGRLPEQISYAPDVPLSEILVRLEKLRQMVHEGPEAMQQRWQEDISLEQLLLWGLFCEEPGIAQAMCGVLATLGDSKAQAMLREVLCDPNVAASVKQSVLATLHTMGAKGPYYAVMEDRLTLVHVSKPGEAEGGAAEEQQPLEALVQDMLRPDDAPMMDALCTVAAGLASPLPAALQARAVVLAYCGLHGIQSPFSSTFPNHRKAERLAARIIKEVTDENH